MSWVNIGVAGVGLLGGMGADNQMSGGINSIRNMPGMTGPSNLQGSFGWANGGGSGLSQEFMGAQGALGGMLPGLFGGGLFNNPDLQGALGQNNIMGALGQANSAFGQQMNPFMSAGFGQNAGGMVGGLLQGGMQNLMGAGNQQGIYDQQLGVLRQGAAPQQQRNFNNLQDRLFSQGLLGGGTSATGEAMRGFFEAQNSQDLGFQNQAFGNAMQQQQFMQGLGSQQMGMGSGLEQQLFQQMLGSIQQNQQAGMGRLGAAQGLLGFGGDLFSQQFGSGVQGLQGLLGLGQFGLDTARSPYELQAGLLSGSGAHSRAMADLYTQRAGGIGSMAGGIGSAIQGIFG